MLVFTQLKNVPTRSWPSSRAIGAMDIISTAPFFYREGERMELQIEYLTLTELKPYEKNAKLHSPEQVEQIKKSIAEFGMNDPIAIWKDNIIIEGHGRLMACKELGVDTVPVIRLDHLTDEQRRAYCLIHNKLTMNTDFDLDLLSGELEEIINIDMTDFGFTLDDIDEPEGEVEEDNYEVELPEEPKAKLGDIYKLGRHRLMCGDSTSVTDLEKLTGGAKQIWYLQTRLILWDLRVTYTQTVQSPSMLSTV